MKILVTKTLYIDKDMIRLVNKLLDAIPRMMMGGTAVSNSGGSGHSHDEAKLYQMIGPNTAQNPDNIDFSLQLYYKDNAVDPEIRELHGNMIISTTGLEDGSIVNAGVLFSLDSIDEEAYDGLDVSWTYN